MTKDELRDYLLQNKDATELDLRFRKIMALPPEIGQLANLQRLDLDNNQLTGLPPEIGHLANLQKLNLRNNQLTGLPSEIGRLANLQRLDLAYNQLTALPPPGSQAAIPGPATQEVEKHGRQVPKTRGVA